ncbi:MAG: 16S rRNA (guanine(527)-N(7))-methyltransferase RsmG [Bacilli bacterium]|nr:16S rRNA (guanine(527)-N(7))-methyltransferase RsmG [Bacilli bacterium]
MDRNTLVGQLELLNISFTSSQIDNLFLFMEDTLEANTRFNLTAIKDRDEFVEKMIFDSAIALYDLDIDNKKIIDIGTGAGFPGMVLKILRPNADVTLLDSTKKKIDHLNELSNKYDLKISGISERAEVFARKNVEKFDYAFARAVSSLNILLELIAPILKVGGTFVALKGKNVDVEIKEAKNALKILGLEITKINNFTLPISKEERNIVLIKKIKPTSNKYSREYNQIKKRPL